MEFPYMILEQLSYSSGHDIGHGWYDVSLFRQVVHYYHDGVIALTWGQFCYQINQDDLPVTIRDLVGHDFAYGGFWKGVHVVAKVTVFQVIHHVACICSTSQPSFMTMKLRSASFMSRSSI